MHLRLRNAQAALVALLVATLTSACPATSKPDRNDALAPPRPAPAAPAECPDAAPFGRPLFGDTHAHTGWSLDAYTFGAQHLDPAQTIAFARGEAVEHPLGGREQLDRPLDFVVVTDHAEFFDLIGMCLLDPANPARHDPFCRELRARPIRGLSVITALNFGIPPGLPDRPVDRDRGRAWVWNQTRDASNAAYEPCRFSTLHGYEWTGGTVSGSGRGNLHRNVIFRSDTVPDEPIDALRWPHESELWQALRERCSDVEDCDVLVIPHNSNYGKHGSMWDLETPDQARLRSEFERIVEIYQHKGDSECANFGLDPQDIGWDAECDFEKIGFEAIPDAGLGFSFGGADDPRPNMVRHALAKGLRYFEDSRFNPLELGIIASTDSHNGTPGLVDEDRYRGGHIEFWEGSDESRLLHARERSGGGLAVVWAPQNTREAIFDALRRREAYGTSGPRIVLRFYATAASADTCGDPDFPAALHAAGNPLPMGGRWLAAQEVPSFVIRAEADQEPLERLQIIRIRPDGDGEDTTVFDIANAGVTGATSLCATWRDPDPQPSRAAAYYARVLERPTPRWTAWACARQPELCDGPAEMIRERAWSSPIWTYPDQPNDAAPPVP